MKKNSKLILVARTWREKSNAEVYLPISKKKIYQAWNGFWKTKLHDDKMAEQN